MHTAPPYSADLLWWKAQVRRRQQAMERLEHPGLAISATTISASVLVMIAVLAAAWKHLEWSGVLANFSHVGWNTWIALPVAVVLFGFSLVAVVAGFGLPGGRG